MKSLSYTTVFLVFLSLPATAWGQKKEPVQLGQDILVEAGEEIGDAVCLGCSIHVRGTLNGDALAIFGGIDISGEGTADAAAIGGNIRLAPGAKLEGDAVAVAGRVERDAQASLGGEAVSLPYLGRYVLLGLAVIMILNVILVCFSYWIAGEQRVTVIASTVREHAGLSLLSGLGVATANIALIIMLVPIWPAALLVIPICLVSIITLLVGYTGISFWLGKGITRVKNSLLAVCLGAVLITLLQFIPLLGLLLFLLFALLSLGSAALSGYGTAPNWLWQRFTSQQVVPPSSPPG